MKNYQKGFAVLPVALIVAVIALLGVGGYYYVTQVVKSKSVPMVSVPQNPVTPKDQQTHVMPEAIRGTPDDFLKGDVSIKCTYSNKKEQTGVTANAVVYIAGDNMRVDITESRDKSGAFGTTHNLLRDGIFYYWWDGYSAMKSNVGTMIDINKIKAGPQDNLIIKNQLLGSIKIDNCTHWAEDESIFVVPQNVAFEDTTESSALMYNYIANPSQHSNQVGGTILGTIIDDLVKQQMPLKCSHTTLSKSIATEWTAYVSDQKVHIDYSQHSAGKTIEQKTMVLKDNIFYRWNGANAATISSEGEKININKLKNAFFDRTSFEIMMDLPNEQVYTCTSWAKDESAFSIPSKTNFRDITDKIIQDYQDPVPREYQDLVGRTPTVDPCKICETYQNNAVRQMCQSDQKCAK